MFRPHPVLDIGPNSSCSTTANNANSRPISRSRRSSIASLLGSTTMSVENRREDHYSLRQLVRSYASRNIFSRGETSKESQKDAGSVRGRSRTRRSATELDNATTISKRDSAFWDNQSKEIVLSKKRHPFLNIEFVQNETSGQELSDFSKLGLYLNEEDVENKRQLLPLERLQSQQSSMPQNCIVMSFSSSAGMDISSVLAQVAGGALESFKLETNQGLKVTLKFLRWEDALKFKEYACSGILLVNGVRPAMSFAGFEPVEPWIREEMVNNGARRCLTLKKNCKDYRKSSRNTSNMRLQLAELDIDRVRDDFQIFGPLVEIVPIVSKRLGFSVHFFDTAHSILAKREFDTCGTALKLKYSDWSIWYGRDPCERGCYEV